MSKRKRKRLSPVDDFTRWCDQARQAGYRVVVERSDTTGVVMLRAGMRRGVKEYYAPSVLNVRELPAIIDGLREQLEQEAA